MTYEFTTDKVGKVTLNHFHRELGKTFKLEGVDAQISDANVIIGGVKQLLSVVGFENEFSPRQMVRTVNQNVVSQ